MSSVENTAPDLEIFWKSLQYACMMHPANMLAAHGTGTELQNRADGFPTPHLGFTKCELALDGAASTTRVSKMGN
jgi:hypothetical protein